MDADTILRMLDVEPAAEHRSDGWWVDVPDLDVRGLATLMRTREVRFVTLTGTPDTAGGYRLIYHWDADGALLNIATTVSTGRIASIADIWPAADWVERELRDYYALVFEGRAETPTLMLLEGDEPGLFSRTSAAGREIDPAVTARDAAEAERKES
jgi:NADH:ubiquinone oxidoreductase subunit C